ncbi:MAG: hypothetical protein LBC85_06640 [Fibromonadaceae bacterium]|jgi:hypothetical protein|nr:hypothetical protein [Fibromonadaceae bacterium]
MHCTAKSEKRASEPHVEALSLMSRPIAGILKGAPPPLASELASLRRIFGFAVKLIAFVRTPIPPIFGIFRIFLHSFSTTEVCHEQA